ncbi:hypothetical protein SAMN00790413_04937 [Deinococcus hopiensis KR-140]|uniref:Uncharacterized protein n=1 Tax=Deinococcus hopiensis KR-140 TaxID=695939 RepID=A0A1W1US17_9DEIO|nr:hypothetical protein SAMN00790413_04937 [Deinococcus hopiensis KR-140]
MVRFVQRPQLNSSMKVMPLTLSRSCQPHLSHWPMEILPAALILCLSMLAARQHRLTCQPVKVRSSRR